MKITCQACSAKYTIADDKVRGRKVKIRCKGCGTPIVVDGQQPNVGDELIGAPSGSEPPPAGYVSPSEQPPPQAPSVTWNVNLSDTDSRTMTTEELVANWGSGAVTSDAYVWKDGMADWVAILECAELAPLLAAPAASPSGTPFGPPVVLAPAADAPAPAPAPAGFPQLDAKPPAGAARLSGARPQGGADLFGGVANAGSEQDVVASSHALPAAPGSTAYDDKPTGARNENSVLFSLDSLKAGFVAGSPAPAAAAPKAPPKAPSARSAQASNPDDPFGMGNQGSMLGMAGGGANALFSLADNTALLTAPAPPEPPPVVASSLDVPGAPAAPSPAQKRKQMILIGAIAGGVLFVGIVLGLVLGGGDDKEEAKDEAAASAKVASDSPKEEKADNPEEKKEEPKKEEPPAEAKKSEDEPKPEEKPEETKAAEPGKKLSSAAAKPKKEEPAAPANAPPFSKASAISALSAAAAQAGGCKKPGGPTGSGKVQVTFAPSGRVTTANIAGPPFAGTAVGGCIAGAFRRAKVPAFSGNPVTVQKSFSVK